MLRCHFQDEIVEVDSVAATSENVTSLLRGSDEVGTLVRGAIFWRGENETCHVQVEIKLKKQETSELVNVILSRMSLAHVHHMQVMSSDQKALA